MAVAAIAAPRREDVAASARRIATVALRKQAVVIDREGAYPRTIMHELGKVGVFAKLATVEGDLTVTIDAMEAVARECVSTAFCCWCQGALTWYVRNCDNAALRDWLLAPLASGAVLGGTALSNPMKAHSGLENLLLHGQRSADGWIVSGAIPWVSNIEAGHPFGVIFSTADGGSAMAVVDDTLDGLRIKINDDYETMSGTATVATKLRAVQVDKKRILAADASAFIPKIRSGFVLIQTGIGLGIMRAAVDVIEATRRDLGPSDSGGLVVTDLQKLEDEIQRLRARTFNLACAADDAEWKAVLQLRLDLAAAALKAATAAQLTAGAIGLRRGNRAVRLVREAAFYGVLTPSVRHLGYMLAQL